MFGVFAIVNAYFYYTMVDYNNAVDTNPVPAVTASTLNFVNDTVKPSNLTTVLEHVGSFNNTLIVRFNYTTSQQGLGIDYFQCTVDNSVWGECSSPYELPLEGYDASHIAHNHTLEIRAVDMKGNVEQSPVVVQFPLNDTKTKHEMVMVK